MNAKISLLFAFLAMLGGKMGEYIQQLNEEDGIPLVVTEVDKNTRICTIMIDTEYLGHTRLR